MRWRTFALVALAGCGRVGFDAIGSAADSGDSVVPLDPDHVGCTPASPSDSFATGGTPCGSLGNVTQNGFTVVRSGGGLNITPTGAPTAGDFGGCNMPGFDGRQDITLEITGVLSGNTAYTNVTLYLDTITVGMQVLATTQMIYGFRVATIQQPYDPVAMRFWRLHPANGKMMYQMSADAQTWVDLSSVDLGSANLASGLITFGAGRDTATGTGTAVFTAINQCP